MNILIFILSIAMILFGVGMWYLTYRFMRDAEKTERLARAYRKFYKEVQEWIKGQPSL